MASEVKPEASGTDHVPRKPQGLLTLEETCAWAATQSAIASRLALDMEHLRESLLEMQRQLHDPSATVATELASRSQREPSLPVVTTPLTRETSSFWQCISVSDGGSPPSARVGSLQDSGAVGTRSAPLALSSKSPPARLSSSNSLAPFGKSVAMTNQRSHRSRINPEGEDFVTSVDDMDVMSLVADMAREKDLHSKSKSGTFDDMGKTWTFLGTEPDRSGWLHWFVTSLAFERILASVIILHAIFIGYSLELTIAHPDFEQTDWSLLVEKFFIMFYIVEIILKLVVHRLYFFVNQNWTWNCLDFVLVLVSLQDLFWADAGSAEDTGFSFTIMRLIRLVRVTKLFRVFRVMFIFRDLRVMLRCIGGSLRSLLWAIITLVCFYYIFAVIFVNGATHYARTDPAAHDIDQVLTWYGSIFTCMHSLYMASTGGMDWHDVGRPLLKVGAIYYALFLFYIAFIVFAVLNIVTGVFVESAIQASRGDIEGRILSQVDEERKFEDTLTGLFMVIDKDSNGVMVKEEFCGRLKEGAPWAFFTTLGLEVNDSEEFFHLLCSYLGATSLDARGFVRGCRRFRSTAKYSDVYMLKSQLGDMQATLENLQRSVETLSGQQSQTQVQQVEEFSL